MTRALKAETKILDVVKCSQCGKAQSVIELRYCGLFLCRACFARFFEKRVRKTIAENHYLQENDRICVGLSGGKDSVVALFLLNEFNARTGGRANIFALTIDHGIRGYDERLMKNAKSICETTGVRQYAFSFKQEMGHGVDEMAKVRPGLCNCGVFRRYLLNKKARELGATKLATGHNLDDEAESVLMNFITGDVRRIMRGEGLVFSSKFIKRIKPLRMCPEQEVLFYARLKFPNTDFSPTCPYRGEVIRMDVKRMIDEFETLHTGMKYQILRSSEKFREALLGHQTVVKNINECEFCGEPTSGRICNTCQLKIQTVEIREAESSLSSDQGESSNQC